MIASLNEPKIVRIRDVMSKNRHSKQLCGVATPINDSVVWFASEQNVVMLYSM